MGYTQKGKRDGSGPHKDSWQRKVSGGKGKRQQSGQRCPAKKK